MCERRVCVCVRGVSVLEDTLTVSKQQTQGCFLSRGQGKLGERQRESSVCVCVKIQEGKSAL